MNQPGRTSERWARSGHPLVMLGEVRTCLVPDSGALSIAEADDLLELIPGRPVLVRERPMSVATSPTVPVGIDCQLATASGTAVHAIGTVATDAVLIGGRLLQSSARTTVVRAGQSQRQPWPHYLSQVGVTEVVTKVKADIGKDLADGYLAGSGSEDTLDLASISERHLAMVRRNPRLDRKQPLLAGATALRWVVSIGEVDAPQVRFRLEDEATRTVRIIVRDAADMAGAQQFCTDLGVHDWLLTVVGNATEEADRFAPTSPESTRILGAVLEHLAHLWMPGVHTPALFHGSWRQLEADPGFSRQWTARIAHVRDRIAVATLTALQENKSGTADW